MILNEKKTYLKTADVKTGDQITIKDEGEWVNSTKFTYTDGTPKKQFNIGVEHNMEFKTMTMNGTNRTSCMGAWGKDTKNWLDKTATIELVKALVGGKSVQVMILNPIA